MTYRTSSLAFPRRLHRPALALAVLAFASAPAFAGRTLKEAKSVQNAGAKVSASDTEAALKAADLTAQCTKTALKSRDLDGLACRLAILAYTAERSELKNDKAIKERVRLALDARATAESIASYKPLHQKPTFAEERFRAHQQACRVVLDAHDAIKGMKPTKDQKELAAAAKDALDHPENGLFKHACECARDTMGLTTGVNLSAEERGALQSVLTSRGCFLDKSKVSGDRGGPESSFTGRASELAEKNTDEAKLLDYAKVRDIGLERCRAKALDARDKLSDAKALEECACAEIKRWSFPKKRERPNMTIDVPVIAGKVGVSVEVTAPGKVAKCGPLTGPLAGK